MNINLSNYNQGNEVNNAMSRAAATVSRAVNSAVNAIAGKEEFTRGSTFSGEVLSVDGNEVTLRLDNNTTLNARLDGNVNVLLGQILSFEVKSTEGNVTSLRPLYTNLTNNSTISDALTSAGMPVNETYARMVSEMMDQGMSINKSAIWDMSKSVNAFSSASPETIVQLTKLGLPIDELSVDQFENYRNFEHQIRNDVDDLSRGLTDLMSESTGDARNAIISENPNLYKGDAAIAENPQDTSGRLSFIPDQDPATDLPSGEDGEISGEGGETVINLSENAVRLLDESLNISADILKLIDTELIDGGEIPEKLYLLAKKLDDAMGDEAKGTLGDIPGAVGDEAGRAGTRIGTREELINEILRDINDSGKDSTSLSLKENISPDMSVRDMLDFVKGHLDAENMAALTSRQKIALNELLYDKDFKQTVKEALSRQMLLKPEEVAKGNDKVEELYQRILKQASESVEILKNTGKQSPQIINSAQNLNNNVNFMNQLNQVVAYVQIPLLMNDESAHGELYVYTNKKKLMEKDGNVSALLHLDMDNLGPMDVYVAMQSNKVNTHFYMQDEATLDFIEENIHILNERLTKKGYDMNLNVTVKDDRLSPVNMADEFLKDEPGDTAGMISKISFDVRA